MPVRFVCLANSYKEGGRCLAGIELDSNNKPVSKEGLPKWIRPVCNSHHGEIAAHLVSHIKLLDIIELEVTEHKEQGYQSENVLFNEKSIKTAGTYSPNDLPVLCGNRPLIFGNKGKAVSAEAIARLAYSLMMVRVTDFEVIEKTYKDTLNKTQVRLIFSYQDQPYDFPVTDPVFLHTYQTNPYFTEDAGELFLCLSLGVIWQDWYYKLVAGVIIK